MKKVLKWFGIFVAVLFVIGVIANKDESAADKATTEASNAARVAEERATQAQALAALPTITSIQLAEDYEENTLAADQKYKGKQFKVTGRVADINTDLFGDPYIMMEGTNIFMQPQFAFDKDAGEQLAKLRKGMKLTLACRGKGDIAKTPVSDKCQILRSYY